jgi:hypothetical protein
MQYLLITDEPDQTIEAIQRKRRVRKIEKTEEGVLVEFA